MNYLVYVIEYLVLATLFVCGLGLFCFTHGK